MGEVKVHVKLSNGIDLGMFRRGLISREEVRSVKVEAVVDTGAVRSCLPIDLMEKLGLQVVRHINAQMANDQTQSVAVTEGVDWKSSTAWSQRRSWCWQRSADRSDRPGSH